MGAWTGAEHADDAGAQGETLTLAKVAPSIAVGLALAAVFAVCGSLHAQNRRTLENSPRGPM